MVTIFPCHSLLFRDFLIDCERYTFVVCNFADVIIYSLLCDNNVGTKNETKLKLKI